MSIALLACIVPRFIELEFFWYANNVPARLGIVRL